MDCLMLQSAKTERFEVKGDEATIEMQEVREGMDTQDREAAATVSESKMSEPVLERGTKIVEVKL